MFHGEGHRMGFAGLWKSQSPEEREMEVEDGKEGKKGDKGQAARCSMP